MTDPARWERIQQLFHQALEMAAEQRAEFLQRECPGDAAIQADILQMLELDAQPAGLLDQHLPEIAGQVLHSEPVVSRKIGPWRIERRLGEGGMGVVFFAVRDDLATSAAIKVLRDSWLSPARRDRFIQEQKTLARLDHPQIARLLDASTLEDGTPYFVMEYVEGLHLDVYCEQRRCSLTERLELFRSVCRAVQFAHSHAVIHRDLKPSNILVTPAGSVKLLDFGISRHLTEFGDPEVTRTGLRLLTPAFAAPEQLRGEPVAVGADVYSLGVILFCLLTGTLPSGKITSGVESPTPDRGRTRPSVAAQEHPLFSGASHAAWSELDVICLKAMHADASRRYPSAEALVRDIDHFLKGEPLEARPDSLTYRLGKFTRRNRVPLILAAAGLVGVAGLATAFTVRLAAERNVALAEAARTQRIQQFLRNLFEGGDPDAGPSHDLRVADLLEKGVLEAQALDKDPAVQAELYQSLGDIYRKLGDLPRAEKLFESALARRQEIPGRSADVVESMAGLALLRADQARLDEAERRGRQALDLSRSSLPAGHPMIALTTESLGRILEEKGDYAAAIPLLEDAVRQRSSPSSSASDLAGSLYELANAYFYAGRYREAEALNLRVLALNRTIYGDRHPRVAEVLVNLGAIQQDLGNYSEAERFHRESLDITRRFFGEAHYRTAAGFTMVARALVFQKRYDDAVPLLKEAVSIQERVFGPVHPRVASAVNELGTVALQKGDTEAAKKQYSRMLAIYRAVYPGGHYLIGTATSNEGSAYMASKDYARAEMLLREAVRIFTATLSAGHLNTAIARVKLGRSLLRQKKFAAAETETLAGYEILRKQMNPSVSWLNSARTDLVEVYAALGQMEKQAVFQKELAVDTKK